MDSLKWYKTLEIGLGSKDLLKFVLSSTIETEYRSLSRKERLTNPDYCRFACKDFKAKNFILGQITKNV